MQQPHWTFIIHWFYFLSISFCIFLLYIWNFIRKMFDHRKNWKEKHMTNNQTACFICISNTCFKAWPPAFKLWKHLTIHPLNWGCTILFISTWIVNTMNFDCKFLWPIFLTADHVALFVCIFHLNFKLHL